MASLYRTDLVPKTEDRSDKEGASGTWIDLIFGRYSAIGTGHEAC